MPVFCISHVGQHCGVPATDIGTEGPGVFLGEHFEMKHTTCDVFGVNSRQSQSSVVFLKLRMLVNVDSGTFW